MDHANVTKGTEVLPSRCVSFDQAEMTYVMPNLCRQPNLLGILFTHSTHLKSHEEADEDDIGSLCIPDSKLAAAKNMASIVMLLLAGVVFIDSRVNSWVACEAQAVTWTMINCAFFLL